MPSTPRTSTPYPAGSDSPNGPSQMQALAEELEKYTLPRFASNAARDAAIAAPTEGDCCVRTDLDVVQLYNGSAWVPLASYAIAGTFTPTLGNGWSNGNATTAGYYEQVGRRVFFWARIQMGTTSVFTAASPTLTLPVAADTTRESGYSMRVKVHGALEDVSAIGQVLAVAGLLNTSTTITLYHQKIAAAPGVVFGDVISSTVPWTWTTNDSITYGGWYWST